MTAAPLDFYFDFGSPYAYLASTQIDDLATRCGRTVAWRPILLGAVFKVTGMKPNMHQPLRGEYLKHDTHRFARLLGIPYTFPAVMPMNSVIASRAYYWLTMSNPVQAHAFAKAIFRAHWVEGEDLSPFEAVAKVAAAFGIDAPALETGVQASAVKERLRKETDDAVTRGVFGAPTIFVDGEPFWGVDRLPQIELWINKGGW
ncbi:2-hydroxychromene-2-carboxylate isomerase [Azospirillaceae bacterium]